MNTPLRILIVDDSPLDAELLVLTLKRLGFAPNWTVTDNAAGLTAALAERPEIVFTDCNMGQFDAGDVLGLVRAQAPMVPVVVVSGSANEEELRQKGAAAFLLKDRLAEIGTVVERVLGPSKQP